MTDTAKDIPVIMTGGTIDAEAYPDPKHPPQDATMLDKSLIPYDTYQFEGRRIREQQPVQR